MNVTEHNRRMLIYHEQERIKEKDNYQACSVFGCGKKLTLIETLAGNKCTGCMSNKKVLIDKVLKRA